MEVPEVVQIYTIGLVGFEALALLHTISKFPNMAGPLIERFLFWNALLSPLYGRIFGWW